MYERNCQAAESTRTEFPCNNLTFHDISMKWNKRFGYRHESNVCNLWQHVAQKVLDGLLQTHDVAGVDGTFKF